MASLKSKRAPIRASFTRTLNELKAEIIKPESDPIMIKRLKKQLDDRFLSLEKVDEQIGHSMQERDATEEEFTEEYNSIIDYRDKFSDVTILIDELFNSNIHHNHNHFERESTHTIVTNVNTRSKYKLPKLELQKFSGDPKEWLGWWSQFKGIHDDVSLSMEHKFQYLIQATVSKSSAHDLVLSFPPTAENYPKAIKYLKSRFGNERILVEVYVRELLKLVLNNSINRKNMISQLYDKLETQLRGLESLGVTSDKYAAMLYPLVESALPDEVLKTWQRLKSQMSNQEEEDQLNLLMKFLRNEVESEICLKLAKTGISIDIENSTEPNTRAMLTSNLTADKVNVCYFCKKPGHIKPYCKQFQKLMAQQNHKDKNEIKEKESANVTQKSDDDDEYDYILSIGNLRANQWILDSGATRHVCHDKNFFESLDVSYRSRMKISNGEYVQVMGIGTGTLKLIDENGKTRTATINNVLYVPSLIGSMLSVSKLTNLNYRVEFGRLIGELKCNKVQIGVADLTGNGIYILRQSNLVNVPKCKNRIYKIKRSNETSKGSNNQFKEEHLLHESKKKIVQGLVRNKEIISKSKSTGGMTVRSYKT